MIAKDYVAPVVDVAELTITKRYMSEALHERGPVLRSSDPVPRLVDITFVGESQAVREIISFRELRLDRPMPA